MEIAKCNVCKQELFSDAKANGYCRLCGMITKGMFCCIDCKNKARYLIYGKK